MPLATEAETHQMFEVQRIFWEPIGKYIFAFGYLEKNIDWCLSALLRLEPFFEGDVVFSQIKSLPSKIKLIGALTQRRTRNLVQIDEVKEALTIVGQHRVFRNGLVHGPWGAFIRMSDDPSSGTWQKPYVSPNSLTFSAFEVSLQDLKEKHSELVIVSAKLVRAVQAITDPRPGAPSPSPDTPDPPVGAA